MAPTTLLALLIPLAYLLGSVPSGLIVGRMKGVDVRAAGSGNIGATNVGRLLGKPYFFLVFFLDMLKGTLPTLLASGVAATVPAGERSPTLYALWLTVGAAAFFGHCYSIFLRFAGGKGVAAAVGVMLGMVPYLTLPGVIGLATFATTKKLTGYVSVASLVASTIVPVSYLLLGLRLGWDVFGRQWPVGLFIAAMAGLIWWNHRANLTRLLSGTEPKSV